MSNLNFIIITTVQGKKRRVNTAHILCYMPEGAGTAIYLVGDMESPAFIVKHTPEDIDYTLISMATRPLVVNITEVMSK